MVIYTSASEFDLYIEHYTPHYLLILDPHVECLRTIEVYNCWWPTKEKRESEDNEEVLNHLNQLTFYFQGDKEKASKL